MDQPLGKMVNLYEDDKGLMFEAKIPKTQLGTDVLELMKAGVITENSVGILPLQKEAGMGDDYNRKLTEVKLYEISAVTLAANDEATTGNAAATTSEAARGGKAAGNTETAGATAGAARTAATRAPACQGIRPPRRLVLVGSGREPAGRHRRWSAEAEELLCRIPPWLFDVIRFCVLSQFSSPRSKKCCTQYAIHRIDHHD